MKFSLIIIVAVLVIWMPVISITNAAAAQTISAEGHQQSQDVQTSDGEGESTIEEPDLAEIIPLATKLSSRLAALENRMSGLQDFTAIEMKYTEIEEDLKGLAGQVQQLKDSEDYRYIKIANLKQVINEEKKSFEKISRPISGTISQLESWRKKWLDEKEHWNQWQSSQLKKPSPDQIKSTFTKAHETIDTALKLVLEHLEATLTIQIKASNIQLKLSELTAELDGLILAKQRGEMIYESLPMFSGRYLSQLSSEFWYAVRNGQDEVSWPDSHFFAQQGWIVLFQGFLSSVVIIALYRKREVLKGLKNCRFLAKRPFSGGLFLGAVTTWLFFGYMEVPAPWRLVLMIVGGISFARLSGSLTEVSWKRQFVYWLIIIYIVTEFMIAVGLPLPLLRLYTVLIALVGLLFCWRWAVESVRNKDSILYTWSLRLVSFYFVFVIVAEVWGKKVYFKYSFSYLLRSTAIVLLFTLFIRIIHGALEWLFRNSSFQRVAVLYGDADATIHRARLFIDVVIWGLVVLPAIIMIWGVYDTIGEAAKGMLALGFNLGSQRISVGLVIVSIGIIYGSFLVSWIFQRLLMSEVLTGPKVERGVRHSMARLVHYVLIFIGFLLAISTLGFDVTKLTIVLGALGVGIGFGLQNIVSNFVSGLILLFERPVRMGDTIEIEGKWAQIKRIGLRATTVQTLDQADVIIPNTDLVTNQVTNWTLSNRRVRVTIPVGVAYGSDVPLAIETLMACGMENSKVAKKPEPQVLFLSFGESSLDLELRVWVLDADYRLNVISELHQEIDSSFREANIEIAFPQQDLHLRSVDDSVILRHAETTR